MAEQTISRKTLYDEIWTESAAKTAKKYGVPYTRFLKLCRESNIPIPPSGYWTKVNMGKPVEKTPLPGVADDIIPLAAETPRGKTDDPVIGGSAPVPEEEKIELEIPRPPTPKYDRQTLYKEVWEEPVTKVAQKYGVSDTIIRRVCKSQDIPIPNRGYWAKLRAGKPVTKEPLPKLKTVKKVEDRAKTGTARKLNIENDALAFLKEPDRVRLLGVAQRLRVAGPGAQLYKDLAKHKEACESWFERKKQGNVGYGRYMEELPLFSDAISKSSFSRAFHIWDALVKALLPFGGGLRYDLAFRVNGETVPFSMSEGRDEIPHEVTAAEKMALLKYKEAQRTGSWAAKPKIPKYDYPWNGKLSLVINETYKFRDCKSYVLEDRIGEIFVTLYEASYAIRLERLKEEEKRRKEEEERRRKEEALERYNHEVSRTRGLVNRANDYDTACKIRAYVAAVEQAGAVDEEWIAWARKKADWFDPTIAREDGYFGARQHFRDEADKALKEKYGW